jgi:hypothetical protein
VGVAANEQSLLSFVDQCNKRIAPVLILAAEAMPNFAPVICQTIPESPIVDFLCTPRLRRAIVPQVLKRREGLYPRTQFLSKPFSDLPDHFRIGTMSPGSS